MNRNRIKKFGRSGGFRRKQEKLVKKIVKTHFAPIQHNTIPIVVHHDVPLNEIANIDGGNQVQVIESHHDDVVNPDPYSAFDDPSSSSDTENVIEVNIENKEKNKDRNFSFNKNKFESMLANWTVENDIKHDQLRGIFYCPFHSLIIYMHRNHEF